MLSDFFHISKNFKQRVHMKKKSVNRLPASSGGQGKYKNSFSFPLLPFEAV